ncbi:MAG: hypothetical protein HY078_04240 [Elusimicrobia bacterium]|nr:hypothetical protein [Elusimicrobiota bacterium]
MKSTIERDPQSGGKEKPASAPKADVALVVLAPVVEAQPELELLPALEEPKTQAVAAATPLLSRRIAFLAGAAAGAIALGFMVFRSVVPAVAPATPDAAKPGVNPDVLARIRALRSRLVAEPSMVSDNSGGPISSPEAERRVVPEAKPRSVQPDPEIAHPQMAKNSQTGPGATSKAFDPVAPRKESSALAGAGAAILMGALIGNAQAGPTGQAVKPQAMAPQAVYAAGPAPGANAQAGLFSDKVLSNTILNSKSMGPDQIKKLIGDFNPAKAPPVDQKTFTPPRKMAQPEFACPTLTGMAKCRPPWVPQEKAPIDPQTAAAAEIFQPWLDGLDHVKVFEASNGRPCEVIPGNVRRASPVPESAFYFTPIHVQEHDTYVACSPLVFDLKGRGIRTTAGQVAYDLAGDGRPYRLHDVAADLGVLAFDADRDGVSGRDGRELFGDRTSLRGGRSEGFKDGFEALEAFVRRAEQEGVLSPGTAAKARLGKEELAALGRAYGLGLRVGGIQGATITLEAAGVREIRLSGATSVRTENFDGRGDLVARREGAVFVRDDGSTGGYEDVFFRNVAPQSLLSRRP